MRGFIKKISIRVLTVPPPYVLNCLRRIMMDQKFINRILATVFGIALLIALTSTVSLLFDAIMLTDVTILSSLSESMEKTISYMQYSSIGIICVSVATLASFCFTYFSKQKKVFGCISAVCSLLLAATCIAFVFDLRAIIFKSTSLESYNAATGYFSELIALAVAALLFFAYFVFVTVRAFRNKTTMTMPTEAPKTEDEAEVQDEKN